MLVQLCIKKTECWLRRPIVESDRAGKVPSGHSSLFSRRLLSPKDLTPNKSINSSKFVTLYSEKEIYFLKNDGFPQTHHFVLLHIRKSKCTTGEGNVMFIWFSNLHWCSNFIVTPSDGFFSIRASLFKYSTIFGKNISIRVRKTRIGTKIFFKIQKKTQEWIAYKNWIKYFWVYAMIKMQCLILNFELSIS